MPWHRRRMTTMARDDILTVIDILASNHGRGYFDTSHLPFAPSMYTDAMKDPSRAGWGWCAVDGHADAGVYGTAWRHKPIDKLEADAVLRAAKARGHTWRGKRVPVHIDNSSFQRSLAKGWSRAPRLVRIIKKLFSLSARYEFVLVPLWISTTENVGADALSRGDESGYLAWASMHAELRADGAAEMPVPTSLLPTPA